MRFHVVSVESSSLLLVILKLPVDGKIVIIEKVFEKEFFKDERLQVSIFMSPLNVHVTRYPICGKVIFSKYHPRCSCKIKRSYGKMFFLEF